MMSSLCYSHIVTVCNLLYHTLNLITIGHLSLFIQSHSHCKILFQFIHKGLVESQESQIMSIKVMSLFLDHTTIVILINFVLVQILFSFSLCLSCICYGSILSLVKFYLPLYKPHYC